MCLKIKYHQVYNFFKNFQGKKNLLKIQSNSQKPKEVAYTWWNYLSRIEFLKSTFPRMLMAHAIPTCPTPTTVILLFGIVPSSSATGAISLSLRVAIVPWKKIIKMIHVSIWKTGRETCDVTVASWNWNTF